MCTVQKVGGEDRSESVLNAIQIHLQGWGWGLSKKQTVVGVVRVVAIKILLQGWGGEVTLKTHGSWDSEGSCHSDSASKVGVGSLQKQTVVGVCEGSCH